jgi:hypothetical protein
MPRVDGHDVLPRARERDHPGVAARIVFVTGDVAGTEAEEVPRGHRLPLGSRSRSGCATVLGRAREIVG